MQSMTGCGRCQKTAGGLQLTIEMKTVNHRFLDVSCRLPRNIAYLEEPVRTAIAGGLKRGHVEVFVTLQTVGASASAVAVDEPLAQAYAQAAEQLSRLPGVTGALSVERLMSLEGVLTVTEAAIDEEAAVALCRETAAECVAQLTAMRAREGAQLAADLTLHLDRAAALRTQILDRAPGVVEDYRARLTERLSRLPVEPVDPARLAQEVALMADKCAVDEELSRLESHIGQMRGYIAQSGEVGKKMDFLVQEMNREANTIGSKANDAVIAQLVVDLKSEIEKLREQIQNVE